MIIYLVGEIDPQRIRRGGYCLAVNHYGAICPAVAVGVEQPTIGGDRECGNGYKVCLRNIG